MASNFHSAGPPPQSFGRPRPISPQQSGQNVFQQPNQAVQGAPQRPLHSQGVMPNSPGMFRPQRPPGPGQGVPPPAQQSPVNVAGAPGQPFRPPLQQQDSFRQQPAPQSMGMQHAARPMPGQPLSPPTGFGQPRPQQGAPVQNARPMQNGIPPMQGLGRAGSVPALGQQSQLSNIPDAGHPNPNAGQGLMRATSAQGFAQQQQPPRQPGAPLGFARATSAQGFNQQQQTPQVSHPAGMAQPFARSPSAQGFAQQQPPQMSQLTGAGQVPSPAPSMTPPVDNLANQMSGMNIGPGGGTRSTRAKRVYASPPGSTNDLYGPQGGQMPSMPGAGGQPFAGPGGQAMNRPAMPAAPGPQFGQAPGYAQPGMPPQPTPPSFMPQAGPGFTQPPSFGTQPPSFGHPPQPNMQQPGTQPPMHHPPGPGGPPGPARSRIDPNQVPSPVVVQENDQAIYENAPFSTTSRSVPPLASTTYRAIDDGNCNPRFIRLTTYNIPCTDELANVTAVPLGMIVQPLADLSYQEEPIDVVDFGESGPIRCRRCMGYVNPYFIFTDGGRKFVCNLCSFENEVPAEYFMNLDMSGRRMDIMRRPELRKGTVDFVASKEYYARPPKPASYVLAIDVTWGAMQSGMLKRAVDAIRELLYTGDRTLPPGTRVGIITFDKSVHFYNLKPTLEQPQMLVVADIGDMFVPLNDGFLVDPNESRAVIENLLDTLPTIFEENRISEPALGAAVQAAYSALKDHGGKLTVFQTMLPTFGPGQLKNREDIKLLGTDKERTLYEPQEYFWKKLGQDCSSSGICVDMFLFPSAYIDIATIGSLAALTGGDIYHYPNFDANRDGLRLGNDLKRSLTRPFGYEALLRIRVSNGLKITEHFGNFYMKNNTDVELAGVHSTTAIGVEFKHDGKLDEKQETAFQAALLYTTATGERRIRVHNISIPNTSLLGNVFRYAEMDTTMCYLCKAAIAQMVNTTLKQVREKLSERCVKILAAYRKHAASSSSPGQLILPESFKLYALYTLCMLKLKAFRGGADMSTDVRVLNMRMIKALGVPESVPLLYPRLMQLHDLVPPYGEVDERGRVKLPPLIRTSAERLNPAGAYVIENGQQVMIWIGRGTPSDFLCGLFGVESLDAVDPKMRTLPSLENPIANRVRNILTRIQSERARYLPLTVVRQQMDSFAEVEFNNLLVEDQNLNEMAYTDYLVAVHRQIQMELAS